jgi:hypothetical protein
VGALAASWPTHGRSAETGRDDNSAQLRVRKSPRTKSPWFWARVRRLWQSRSDKTYAVQLHASDSPTAKSPSDSNAAGSSGEAARVFISYEEDDSEMALTIALALERAGYPLWCYEIDSVPGVSYLLQTGQAIDESRAFLLLISARSVESSQVTRELIRAHEYGKLCIPVLRDISHAEFVSRQPEWRAALGGATSIRILTNNASDVIPRIVEGLAASGLFESGKKVLGGCRFHSTIADGLQRAMILPG